MLVPSKTDEIVSLVLFVFSRHAAFGLPAMEGDRAVSLPELLEVILGFPDWFWLTGDDLQGVITRSPALIVDEQLVRLKAAAPDPIALPARPRHGPPSVLFLPVPTSTDPVTARIKLYGSLDVALLVSASRTGTFEEATVMELAPPFGDLATLENDVFTAPASVAAKARPVPAAAQKTRIEGLVREIKLQEVLYLDDPILQGDAARYLFQAPARLELEQRLLSQLTATDRYVRMNVLTALGVPSYSVGFVPGELLLPREERLAESLLHPDTISAICDFAQQEQDPGVLDYVVCTLKSQSYEGKLLPTCAKVRHALQHLLPRLVDEQARKDAKELLAGLRD